MNEKEAVTISLPSEEELAVVSVEEITSTLNSIALEEIKRKRIIDSIDKAVDQIEKCNKKVSDIVMNVLDFSKLRVHKGLLEIVTDGNLLRKGYFATLLGYNIWVNSSAKVLHFFSENSKELENLFPEIAAAKNELNI